VTSCISVSVELSERNETKGKEIELEALTHINQQYFPSNTGRARVNSNSTGTNNGGTLNGANVAPTQLPQKRQPSRQTQIPPIPTSIQTPLAPPVLSSRSQQNDGVGHMQNGSVSSMGSNINMNKNNNMDAALEPIDENRPAKNRRNDEKNKQQIEAELRRKSNCVKEIEKIQKNREQRRAKQEEKRQKISETDTTVPAYEFAHMISEFRAGVEFTRLTNSEIVPDLRIAVCVRKRPINRKEITKKDIDVITMPNKDHLLVHMPKLKVDLSKYLDNQKFRFDFAFEENTSNDVVYRYSAQPLVNTVFQGGTAMCFAYGQTGSGKTFTMGGDFSQKNVDCSKGIYALTARDIFKQINGKYKGTLEVFCTFFEIYCGKVYDLLNQKKKLRVLEDHKNLVQVVDLREQPLNSVEDVLNLIQYGMNIRTSGTTSANQHSSRSHAVFQIILKNAKNKKEHGKISLIDLAGSERGKDTSSSDRITRMEGAEINKSLLALKECIRALSKRDAHVPFRGSTLTKVLRDSFIGDNSKVCMIAMISPGNSDVEHTLNTLRYADRVKELGADEVNVGKKDDDDEESQNNLEDEEFDEDNLTDDDEDNYDEEDSRAMNDLQETLAELQDLEEQVLESHGDYVRDNHKWMQGYEKILEDTQVVDYDREEYAKRFDVHLKQNIEFLMGLQTKVAAFREGLIKEEKISKTIQQPKNRKH